MAESSSQYSQNNTGDATGIQAEVSGGEVYQGKTVNVTKNYFSESRPALKPGAPSVLPSYYVPRPEHSDKVKAALLATGEKAAGTLVVSAIYGLGGIGKSVLAAALAHDPEVQEHFKDGVLWVTLGQEPDLLPKLGGWLHALGDYNSKPTSMDVAVTQLRLLLQEKQMLLVIDDVWEPEHAEPFRVGGSNCCVLITTREAQIKNAKAHNLDEMKPEQALQMLKQRLPEREFTAEDEEKAQLLAKEVGYLPLALELAAAQVEDEVGWGELLEDLQAEIADLASFDGSGLALKTGKDEKQLRDRSLLASFNLSLKRLPREQLEQFAWLGIVQEDAEINRTIAAKLWGVKLREARALLQFFKQRALLMPGGGQGEQATYRTHDLVRSISKRLLTSPGEGDGGFAFVGFETSLAEAHSVLLGRYRETTASGLWHELEDDGYIFAQLTWHMEQAGQEALIHQLFQETTAEGRNGWYEACDKLGKLSYFVTDLGRAWALAEELFEEDATEAIVLQWRYALIQTTLNSLAQNIPAELLSRFVETGFWSPAQGLAYAQQIQNSYKGSQAISQLIPHLPESLLLEALEIARNIDDEFARSRALGALGPLLPNWMLQEFLETTRNIQADFERANVLCALAHKWPTVLPEALDVTRSLKSREESVKVLSSLARLLPESILKETWRLTLTYDTDVYLGYALHDIQSSLAAQLPDSFLEEALEEMEAIRSRSLYTGIGSHLQASTLIALAPRLTESLLAKALRLTDHIEVDAERAKALCALAHQLPHFLLPEVVKLTRKLYSKPAQASVLRVLALKFPEILPEALEITRSISDELERAEALRVLALQWPEVLPEVLEITRSISDELERAEALRVLALQWPEVLPEALEITRSIGSESERAEALSVLAPQLPEVWPEVLKLACNIKDEYNRASVLSAFVSQLPESLLPEALALARNINNEYDRAKALSALAPTLPKSLLQQALELTRNINDESARAEALSTLAPKLPRLWSEALALTRNINSESARAEALSRFVLQLPQTLLSEALELTRNINNEYDYALALRALAPHLLKSLLPEALELTCNINSESYRARTLSVLAPHLSESLFLKAWELTLNIKNEYFRAKTLSAIASQLPESLLPEAFELTCNISNESYRALAFSALVPQLTDSMLPEAVELTRNIHDESAHAEALSALTYHLPEFWPEAWEATCNIHDESSRASALSVLAPQLPAYLLPEALEATRNIHDESSRTSVLKALTPQLPEYLLPEALEATHNIQDESSRSSALSALAPQLQESMLPRALELTRNIKNKFYRFSVLITLAGLWPEIWPEVLELTRNIESESKRASALITLASQLPESLIGEAFNDRHRIKDLFRRTSVMIAFVNQWDISEPKYLHETLRIFGASTRPDLIQDLPKLERFVVTTGGKAAFDGALQAMREVCTQWK